MAQDDRGLLDAQRRGRLVEDQHAGAEVLGARDGQRLALAAGQRADQLVGVAHLDADLLQLFAGDPGGLLAVEALNGTKPFVGSLPRKKLRLMLISGITARSW